MPVSRDRSFVSHARVIGSITFASRVLGLVREMVTAQYFGAGPVLAAFKWAFALPNLFRKLLGEGALSAAFIPLYTRARREADEANDADAPGAFASAAVTVQVLLLVAVTLLGEAALGLTLAFRPLRDETELAVKLAMVMLPYVVFVCVAALLGGVLQVHRRFVATTATAVVLNALMIAAIVGVASAGYDLTSDAGQRAAVWWLAIAVLVAGAAQAALLWPSLVASGVRLRPTTSFWTPSVKRMLRMTAPVALGLGVLQLGVLLDKQIAMTLSPQDAGETAGHFLGLSYTLPLERGALVRLDLAQYLYQFPLGVFGIALATAIFPQLSGDALDAGHDAGKFRDVLARGIKASLFIGLPASAGMAIVALPAVRLLFERGQFTHADSVLTARSTAVYSLVIWAFSLQQILNRGYYALHDMRAPLVWGMVNLAINVAIELPLLWTPLAEAGMAVGTAASFLVQTTAMTWLLCRRVGLPIGSLAPSVGKMSIATLGMAAACAAVRWGVAWPDGGVGSAACLGTTMAVGAVVYFGSCYAMRLPIEGLVRSRRP